MQRDNSTKSQTLLLDGTVRNGVIVPEGDVRLDEGIRVQILLPSSEAPQLQPEFPAWDEVGEEAWEMISRWEEAPE